jgi:hypothetical protein
LLIGKLQFRRLARTTSRTERFSNDGPIPTAVQSQPSVLESSAVRELANITAKGHRQNHHIPVGGARLKDGARWCVACGQQ